MQDCLELSSNTFPPHVFISLLSSHQFIAMVSRMLPERPAVGETQPPGNTLHTWWRILHNRVSNRTDDFTDSRGAIKANLLANGAAKAREFVPHITCILVAQLVCKLIRGDRAFPVQRLAEKFVNCWQITDTFRRMAVRASLALCNDVAFCDLPPELRIDLF